MIGSSASIGRSMISDPKVAVGILFSLALFPSQCPASDPEVVFQAEADAHRAPHGRGNLYAPEVFWTGKEYRLWFGGQGTDGHDRIHLATSTDGQNWKQHGVVLEDPTANHCNDPSVVEDNGMLYMYYTRAGSGVTDEIAVATSSDGVRWMRRGTAIAPGKSGAWDSWSVGRPSVLVENGVFRMWYDGRKDLPPSAPDPKAPKSDHSQRFVGYATSQDGLHWRKHGGEPVYDHDAGGVHVLRTGDHLSMLIEGRLGTEMATSKDGVQWTSLGILLGRFEGALERHGHVTPFLLRDWDGRGATLYYGAATEEAWNANTLCRRRLSKRQWQALLSAEPIAEASEGRE
jgi:sucrose-6-phosphate hydrolase SacC (GH32 family)